MQTEVKLQLEEINPAPYNPRKITKDELSALENSMEEFGNISGITYNGRTKNLVTGHQRMDILKKEYPDLEFRHLKEDYFSIVSKKKGFTGYLLRVVDWDEAKEKAANVVANSHTVQGKFDLEILPDLLKEIKVEMPDIQLGLDQLTKDLGIFYDLNMGGSIEDRQAAPRGETPEETKRRFDANPIKQIHLLYHDDVYEDILGKFEKVMKDLGLSSYSEVVVKLLELYEDNNLE